MTVAGAMSSSAGEIAVFTIAVMIFFGLPALHGLRVEEGNRRWLLILACLAGIAIAVIGLLLGSRLLMFVVLAILAMTLVSTAIAIAAEASTQLPDLVRRPPSPTRPLTPLSFGLGLLLLAFAGVAMGLLLHSGRGTGPTTFVAAGGYRVAGTCANGACTVNECREASPCGLENEGRLAEGKPVDVVCQTIGEKAVAPNGRRSRIWDRLPSGLYISDLFVEGTVAGRFTPRLPHCSDA